METMTCAFKLCKRCEPPAPRHQLVTLARQGVDPNEIPVLASSGPLHRAVFKGHSHVARLLLEHGADPCAPDGCVNYHASGEDLTD
jgi:ankyrin repeat protein